MVDEVVTNMRDDIEAAIVALGDESGVEPVPVIEPTDKGEVLDAEGEAAKTKAAAETSAGEASGEIDASKAPAADESVRRDAEHKQSAGDIAKAPESWQPAAREGWNDLPEPIRAQIHKRETEINKALMDGSDNRKRGEQFSDIAGRYAQVIAAEGVTDPIQGFEAMMKVIAQLRMGNPHQKASKLAEFITGYGVDIELLDTILSGQPQQPAQGGNGAIPPAGDPNRAYIDQQLQPVHQLLGRLNEQDRQANLARNQAYMTEVVKFKAENEFYTDVQHDMADLCDMATKRGYDMPLAESYAKACAMNPEISKVLAGRASAAQLEGGSQVLLNKREASSSLMSGQQAGPPVDGKDLDLRGEINAAWDKQREG